MKKSIRITLNGEERAVDVEPQELLHDVLRHKLGATSPKIGCGKGDCGSCTVMLNGKTVRSCLILAVEAEGHAVTTLEGLGQDGPTPLQEVFIKKNAFQCGYCAPGMVLAATELLERNRHPSEEEVEEALGGNLCRCTGYRPIVDAILEVSRTS